MRRLACLPIFLVVACVDCGPTVDLSKGLEVQDVSTGWFDAGIVNGRKKLVPSISFKVRNVSAQKLVMLQVNALFRRVTEQDEWGSGFVTVAGSEGLPAEATTPMVTINSHLGYTGANQTSEDMLHNSRFIDAKVSLSFKYGSTQWTPLGEYSITRMLITK